MCLLNFTHPVKLCPCARNFQTRRAKMKRDFWLERWERGETGFHQDEINPYLLQHWPELHVAPGGEVFVPLCGKSLDMVWLRERGYFVLGVELSPIAVQDFF